MWTYSLSLDSHSLFKAVPQGRLGPGNYPLLASTQSPDWPNPLPETLWTASAVFSGPPSHDRVTQVLKQARRHARHDFPDSPTWTGVYQIRQHGGLHVLTVSPTPPEEKRDDSCSG